MNHRGIVLSLTLGLGCIGDLDPRTVVVSPRILDIVAEAPEVAPGGIVVLRALLGGARGAPVFHWNACISADPTGIPLGTSGFGAVTSELGCVGDSGSQAIPLGDEATASLPIPLNALDRVESLISRFGAQLPPETLRRIVREVGLVLGIGLRVEVDGRTLRGYKRVVLSRSSRPNHNPPAPSFRMGTRALGLAQGSVDLCVPDDGSPLRFMRGQTLDLVPDPGEGAWFERYSVIDATGQIAEREEKGFYSWYVTSGSVALGLTRTPVRDNRWTLPERAGRESLWLLVRDGHGGSSGCRVDLEVF